MDQKNRKRATKSSAGWHRGSPVFSLAFGRALHYMRRIIAAKAA
jgi:hypothetical protein